MIRKFYFGTSWKDLNGNNVLLLQLPHKGLDGIIFLHEIDLHLRQLTFKSVDAGIFLIHDLLLLGKVFVEGVNDVSVSLAHLLHLLSEGLDGSILLRDHQLALLEIGFEGVNDGSILLSHILNVGVEGVNEGVLLFNLLVSPLSKGVSE